MADADKSTMDEAAVQPPKSKLVPALLVLNTLLVVGVLAFTLLRKPAAAPAAAPAAEAHAEEKGEAHGGEKEGEAAARPSGLGPIVAMDNFIVQLRAVEAEKYAHITIEMELADDKDKDIIANYMPRIRDTIIGYLADRTADELRGSEGMRNVKEEVLVRLKEAVPGRRVRNVYITSFIVQ